MILSGNVSAILFVCLLCSGLELWLKARVAVRDARKPMVGQSAGYYVVQGSLVVVLSQLSSVYIIRRGTCTVEIGL